jgi:hypothetical protein
MISKDCTITIDKGNASVDEDVYLYKNDMNIQILFTIVNNKYRYTKNTAIDNIIANNKASYAQVKFKKGDIEIDFEEQETKDGAVVLLIKKELIDEDTELGDYSIQIRLFDENKTSVITLPPVENCIHIQRPLFEKAGEDTNIVDQAFTDMAVVTYAEPISATNSDGTYNKKTWISKEKITTAELNRMEEGISNVSTQYKDIAKQTITTDERNKLNNLKNYDDAEIKKEINGKASKNEIFTMANMGQDIKEAMTGGSVAVVGKKSINDENVIYSSLSEDKLTDCTCGKNLINVDRIKHGVYMSSSSGILNSGTSSTGIDCISDYIYVDSSINSKIICNKACGYVFFDRSLNYVSGRVPGTSAIDIPPNATYVVLNLYSSGIDKIQLEYGETTTQFEFYNYKLQNLNIEEQFKKNSYYKDIIDKANVYITQPNKLKYKIIDVNSDTRGCLYIHWDTVAINIRPIDDTYNYNVMFEDSSFDNAQFEIIDNIRYVKIPHVNALTFDIIDKKLKIKSYKEIDYTREIELICFAWMRVIKGAMFRYFFEEKEITTPTASDIDKAYKVKTVEIQNNLFNTFDDILSYVQITDLHSDYKNVNDAIDRQLNSIVDLSNRNGFDFIALTGDITSGANKKDVTLNRLTEIVEILKKVTNTPILFLNGNHDDNSYVAKASEITEDMLISKKEWYNRVLAPFRLGEMHDTHDKYSRYYYLDLPIKKIRLICLDASDAPKEYLDGGIVKYHGRNYWGYGNRQVHWLNEVLTDVSKKEGWNVVILSHMCARSEIASRNYVYENGKVLEDILSAFQKSTTFTGQCKDKTAVSCDFTNNKNKVLVYHYGHNHASIRYKQNSSFLYSCTPNASPSVIDSSIIPSNVGFKIPTPRTINTISEGCYDIFKLTPTNLISYRFGAGDDENSLL